MPVALANYHMLSQQEQPGHVIETLVVHRQKKIMKGKDSVPKV